MPGLAPLMNIKFWGPSDIPIIPKQLGVMKFLKSSLRKFTDLYKDFIKQY